MVNEGNTQQNDHYAALYYDVNLYLYWKVCRQAKYQPFCSVSPLIVRACCVHENLDKQDIFLENVIDLDKIMQKLIRKASLKR